MLGKEGKILYKKTPIGSILIFLVLRVKIKFYQPRRASTTTSTAATSSPAG